MSETGAATDTSTAPPEPRGLSYAEAGAEIGVTKQRIGIMVQQGRLPLLHSGLIDAEAWRRQRREHAERAAAASLPPLAGAGGPNLSAKERREELALLRDTTEWLEGAGRLTDAVAVEAVTAELFRRMRDRFLGRCTRRIAEECLGETVPRVLESKAKGILAEELTREADALEAEADGAEPHAVGARLGGDAWGAGEISGEEMAAELEALADGEGEVSPDELRRAGVAPWRADDEGADA